jgi:hypothetical protein
MADYHKSPAKQDGPYGVIFCGTIAVPELYSQGHSLVMTQQSTFVNVFDNLLMCESSMPSCYMLKFGMQNDVCLFCTNFLTIVHLFLPLSGLLLSYLELHKQIEKLNNHGSIAPRSQHSLSSSIHYCPHH